MKIKPFMRAYMPSVVRPASNFSFKQLLLKNHRANFNQI